MPRKICLVLLVGLVAVLGNPFLAPGQEQQSVGQLSVIHSTIGDFDCFGFGAPTWRALGKGVLSGEVDPSSPCGTLPGPPIPDVSDAPDTDVVVDCSESTALTFTHTLDIPPGSTILGGAAAINIGGVQKSLFNTVITADGVPAPSVPDTGELGTALIIIPLTNAATSLLADGQVVLTIKHGSSPPRAKCNPIFVDFSTVVVLVQLAP